MTEYSNHRSAYEVLQACIANGVKQVVISPGSRNAPLVLTFAKQPDIECFSVVDERTAAFFALGLSQQSHLPTALVCTSGTAVLNYAPAVAEAYEQNIPLLVISADRPEEFIDQGVGQAIRQKGILNNFVEKHYQLPAGSERKDVAYARRMANEAVNLCKQKHRPVHINIPFWEPLYDKTEYDDDKHKVIHSTELSQQLTKNEQDRLLAKLNDASSVLIVGGFISENSKLNDLLDSMVNKGKAVVLTESIANQKSDKFYYNIDRLLSAMPENSSFQPDLLITFGGTLISKMVKQWLRKDPPKEHWHLNKRDYFVDTFQCLSENIPLKPEVFFEQISKGWKKSDEEYSTRWRELAKIADKKHHNYLKDLLWSDFQAFNVILKNLPAQSLLHLGNSTVIRYHQLFPYNAEVSYFSNRGVSGIDGCTSTAVGAAYNFDGFTTLITGDISLGYDSNALWHQYVNPKLRIIVINNGGGGIFRFLEASSKHQELEQFFETTHSNQSYEHLASHWGINYQSVDNKNDLELKLKDFYTGNKARILEIFTPQIDSAKVLRGYFRFMKKK
ncbi:2-succinyl-5-enolpyruvyl-6-hydroxy-3-cyclohexene-1-carboxylate synthase [Balneicella halophila]|uniref:2-succinyl-5-enolpyruvyl-6-hydroxy-3-cyclohexene-1-carboxylate synthase n=1 Tax=Balneicella halophila TaxID=1537566 RepID=A0A7L4UQ23_BALHA|nr:2-succinyl-5-enolpyruvyl-6-hydroxy-3-cyclohexene-1-carboxylic-acid synthase [Balneicella halophila]PVX51843.1 2-succinyl-5-enolpyruvyl-6-hydroxy-3-cyclohexene-1-carboxylate synthase [Balneicella halophila]